MDETKEIEVKVAGLVHDKLSEMWIVMLEECHGKRVLPIWIGPFEAKAIAMEMTNSVAPRPMTHDLIRSIIEALYAKVQKVVVEDLRDNTYYASLSLEHNGKQIVIDARPSDSIAIALKFKAPIYVTRKVMETAGTISVPDKGSGESDKWIDDFLKEVEKKYLKKDSS